MRKLISFLPLLFQLLLTFTILFIVYIIYALLDGDEADMINGIAFIIFQPLFGFILTIITIGVCLIVGLPIRLMPRIKQWWLSKPILPILGFALGLLLLVISFNTNLTETKEIAFNGEIAEKEVPNTVVSLSGWFLTAFSLLHLYPQSLLNLFDTREKKY